MNCSDNSGAKVLFMIGAKGIHGRLNRLPNAGPGDMIVVSVKKGKPDMRKKVMMAVVVRQRRPIHRCDGTVIHFEDNAAVIVKPDGQMKGNTILGPIAKEAAELWPKVSTCASTIF